MSPEYQLLLRLITEKVKVAISEKVVRMKTWKVVNTVKCRTMDKGNKRDLNL